MKIKKVIVVVLIAFQLFLTNTSSVYSAGCVPIFNPITNVDWSMFVREFRFLGICACGDPIPRVGFKIRYAEPIGLIETSQKPFFFPSLNLNLGVFSGLYKVGNQLGGSGSTVNTHFLWYPVFWVLNILSDVLCMQVDPTAIDFGYLSEVDPTWTFDELNHYLQPEKLLYSNPIAQAVCLADCAASTLQRPLNGLYWCAGCWGGIYPDTGNVQEQKGDDVTGANLIATRFIDKAHTAFMFWATSPGEAVGAEEIPDSICQPVPFPRIIKSQYWLQPACPVIRFGYALGTISALTSSFAKAPGFEDYVFVLWRKRICCLL
jgi:conjugal transfer pilus assembly protein TraU